MFRAGLTGIRIRAFLSKYCDQFSAKSGGIRYSVSPKTLHLLIHFYSNQAEEFGFNFFNVNNGHVDGEQLAFCHSHQSLGRQMKEHYM